MPKLNYVVVSAKSYGSRLHGIKIYYENERPRKLREDGSIIFGKILLELFTEKLSPFQWIITDDIDEIKQLKSKYVIKTSLKTINRMYSRTFGKTRDLKLDIVYDELSPLYPQIFGKRLRTIYKSGLLASFLDKSILSKLSSADKDAIDKFIPEYLTKESFSAQSAIKAKAQIKTLKSISSEIKQEITKSRSEAWWQNYIKANVLVIQQGYIYSIDKINVSLGNTKYPDFVLVTHDSFLDILEIKKPNTSLVKFDESRNNYYWDLEISKAIIQVENYIEYISKNAENIRGYIKDNHGIDLKVIRPRGIILAGSYSQIANQKGKDDYRLLSLANKNIQFLNYDELADRLDNYINVLSGYAKKV